MNKANSSLIQTNRLSLFGFVFILFTFSSFTLSANDRENNHPWQGVWLAEQVGIVFDIRKDYYLSYQIDGHQCFRPNGALLPAVGPMWEDRIAYAKIHSIKNHFKDFYIERFSTPEKIRLSKIEKMPDNCRLEGEQSTESIIDGFFYNFEHFYAGFKIRNLNRSELINQYRKKAQEVSSSSEANKVEENLFSVFSEFIDQLDDQHVFVLSIANDWWHVSNQSSKNTGDSAELANIAQQSIKSIQKQFSKSKLKQYANKAISAGTLNESVFYLQINRLINYAPLDNYSARSASALKSALNKFSRESKKAKRLIIDLRFNEGGSINFANQIASFITGVEKDIPRTSGATVYGDLKSDFVPLGTVYANTKNRFKHIEEIWILISHRTASAAEYLVHNLQVDKRVKTFGEPSRGTWSPTLVKSLSNGWIFTVPNYLVINDEGYEIESKSINPEFPSKSSFVQYLESPDQDLQFKELLDILKAKF